MPNTDTDNGFVCVSPWASVDKTLVIDIKCNLSSVRLNRNILSARMGIKSQSNTHQEAGLILPKVANGQAASQYEYTHVPGNLSTVLTTNRPVRLKIKTLAGELDMGLVTAFVLTAPLIGLTLINEQNEGNVEVNLIVI